jgi:hypothetical protein
VDSHNSPLIVNKIDSLVLQELIKSKDGYIQDERLNGVSHEETLITISVSNSNIINSTVQACPEMIPSKMAAQVFQEYKKVNQLDNLSPIQITLVDHDTTLKYTFNEIEKIIKIQNIGFEYLNLLRNNDSDSLYDNYYSDLAKSATTKEELANKMSQNFEKYGKVINPYLMGSNYVMDANDNPYYHIAFGVHHEKVSEGLIYYQFIIDPIDFKIKLFFIDSRFYIDIATLEGTVIEGE